MSLLGAVVGLSCYAFVDVLSFWTFFLGRQNFNCLDLSLVELL